jgi:hypothetical protein
MEQLAIQHDNLVAHGQAVPLLSFFSAPSFFGLA